MTFVRLGGCSVGCPECDTDYRTVEKLDIKEVVQRIENISVSKWVWLTGGEPMDQDLNELCDLLHQLGKLVAIATSGIKKVPSNWADWISVSPHSTKLVQKTGQELKIVPGLNGLRLEDVYSIDVNRFENKFIQPLWGINDKECIDFVLNNPEWRLGIQAHKYWGIK